MRRISMYRNWEGDVETELMDLGFEFVSHTWLPDKGRIVEDEELWLNKEKGLFLWIDHINISAWLYIRVRDVPKDVEWEDLNEPHREPRIYVSTDDKQRWIKIVYTDGTVEFYRKCIEADDFIEEGIPVNCNEEDIKDLEEWWATEEKYRNRCEG